MRIEHNSRQRFFRHPYGAVPCGSYVRMRISAEGAGIPRWVRIVYKTDNGEEQREDMPYLFSVLDSCIYEKKIKMPDSPGLIWYYFEVATDAGVVYYGNNSQNLGGHGDMSFQCPSRSFQITVYEKNYETPEWFKTAVAYQIFPDRFFNGNENGEFLGDRTDIIKREWGDMPYYKAEQFGGEYKANDFFGGNLEGIIKKLPYLEDLGITVIYLNPIFRAASNHKYDTGSYEEIDPMFGDEETFSRLCSEAKARGIRIILDGVFNHTGDDSMYFNKYGHYDTVGAYQSKESPYYSWYRFMQFPDEYESWWGMKTLPQIEENSKELREYMLTGENAIVKKWIRLGASGWRLDVVDELPDFFVRELRESIKSVNPDAVIIGEVWEDASTKIAYGKRREYFYGNELDSVMNYPFRNAMIDFALCRIKASEFSKRVMNLKENYPAPAFYSLLNMISSHDVERVTTLMSGAPTRHEISRDDQARFSMSGYTLETARKRTKLLFGLLMTLPGVPCLFYGDELGVQGYGDPFCRSCFPWDKMDDVDPNAEMRNWVKSLIKLRKAHKALSVGELEEICAYEHTYSFIRWYSDMPEELSRYDEEYVNSERCRDIDKLIVTVNYDSVSKDVRLDVARFGITKLTAVLSENNSSDTYESGDGIFYVKAQPNSITIYQAK